MNEYKETAGRTGSDPGTEDVTDPKGTDLTGRRKPLIVGSGTVTSDAADETTDTALTTADIAAKDQQSATRLAAPVSSEPAPVDEPSGPLFSSDEAKDFRSRSDGIQVGFVDEPRRSVEQADNLVASTIKRLAEVFADERQRLEDQWSRGENVSTEDLRLALRRYRSFFGRLLSV
jgi:hypothetical protein